MSAMASVVADCGLEVVDLQSDPDFMGRPLHERNPTVQMAGMHRVARSFVDAPEQSLQELVNAGIELCGADSAGISVEREGKTEDNYYEWVATAGEYAGFQNAMLPRLPSACGICLERGKPQRFRVSQGFFDLMGIEAALVTDGILLPWQLGPLRGTIWIMAHGRTEAFDVDDYHMMQMLADFTALGMKQHQRQQVLIAQAQAAAAVAMANDLAHQINNPLQCLTNLIYLATRTEVDVPSLAQTMSEHIDRLTALVSSLLVMPSSNLQKSSAPGGSASRVS